jgi:hypothetical protein
MNYNLKRGRSSIRSHLARLDLSGHYFCNQIAKLACPVSSIGRPTHFLNKVTANPSVVYLQICDLLMVHNFLYALCVQLHGSRKSWLVAVCLGQTRLPAQCFPWGPIFRYLSGVMSACCRHSFHISVLQFLFLFFAIILFFFFIFYSNLSFFQI